MSRALCLIREDPGYRRSAFVKGLHKAGFDVSLDSSNPRPGDVLVIWNRYALFDEHAAKFEQAGVAVIVAENAYLGHRYDAYAKPCDAEGQPLYSLALGHHNGAGHWWIGEPGRWRQQGIEVRPWREDGEHILVLPQRGIGPPGVAMPEHWPQYAVARLQARTKRRVVLRDHPGNAPATRPLQADLEKCWAAVTWGSGAALKAICAGVPVFSDFIAWIGRRASLPLEKSDLEKPLMCDAAREAMLDRLAWAQHTVDEIGKGHPFRQLMALYQEQRGAA